MELDHLVIAAPCLQEGVNYLQSRLHVTALPGGRHPELGTVNAILPLRGRSYLEILAPDSNAKPVETALGYQLQNLAEPRIAAFALRSDNLEELCRRAQVCGIGTPLIENESRTRPDGVQLSWRTLTFDDPEFQYSLPFYIDWQRADHPSGLSAGEYAIETFCVCHPHDDRLRAIFGKLGIAVAVARSVSPGFELELSHNGRSVRL